MSPDLMINRPIDVMINEAIVRYILWFVALLACTLYSCYIGDDDVVHRFMGRKPTPQEALSRIRFVIFQAFATFFAGIVATLSFIYYVIFGFLEISISGWQPSIMVLFFMLPSYALIVGAQNLVRLGQGRQARPLFDKVIFRYNLRQWKEWGRN